MLPEITIEGREITVKNVNQYKFRWPRVLDNIRRVSGYRLHEIAAYSGCTHTRIMHSSAYNSCRFSNCEQIALLDLYKDVCGDANHDVFLNE
jgi:hypothetical protein